MTLSIDQAYQRITSWIGNNGGCKLPCIWGLHPGETDRSEIELLRLMFNETYLSENIGIWVKNYDDLGGVTLIFHEGDIQTNIDMSYYFKGQTKLKLLSFQAKSFQVVNTGIEKELHYIFGNKKLLEFVDDYTLAALLSKYGVPTSVLIAPYYNERPELPAPSWIWLSVVLIYENQGILAEYIMPRRMIGNTYAACVDQNLEITIITWDPEQPIQLSEILSVSSFLGLNKNNIDYFLPIDEGSTISISDFSRIFINPDSNACVYTPMELWPGQ